MHDDLVARQFTAAGPDRTWLTDITEHPTAEGKLYLCAFKDVYSGRIVGYSMDSRMTARPGGLRAAQRHRPAGPAGTLVVHSDRGSQFRSAAFVRALKDHGLTGSMGRVGACGDNAAMESFFALLQKNVLDRQRWSTREQLRLAIITWIETHLPPPAPATTTRPPDPHRIRDNQPGRTRRLNHQTPESTKAGALPSRSHGR